MRFEALKLRVERTEALVDGRAVQTVEHFDALRGHWRDGLTPPRILIAGLLAGFVTGRARPARTLRVLGKLGGPSSLRTIGALTGLATSLQAAFAALTAKAADAADDAADEAQAGADSAEAAADAAIDTANADMPSADDAGNAGPLPPSDRRRRAEPAWTSAPAPAEAATELSER